MGIAEEPDVVVEAVEDWRRSSVPLREAQIDRAQERIDEEAAIEHDGRQDEVLPGPVRVERGPDLRHCMLAGAGVSGD